MTELMIFVGGLLVLMAIGLPVVVAIGVTSFIAGGNRHRRVACRAASAAHGANPQ